MAVDDFSQKTEVFRRIAEQDAAVSYRAQKGATLHDEDCWWLEEHFGEVIFVWG